MTPLQQENPGRLVRLINVLSSTISTAEIKYEKLLTLIPDSVLVSLYLKSTTANATRYVLIRTEGWNVSWTSPLPRSRVASIGMFDNPVYAASWLMVK